MKFDYKELTVKLGEKSYPIFIGPDLIGNRKLWWPDYADEKVFVVTDENVGKLYAPILAAGFGDKMSLLTIPAGEQSKSFAQFKNIADWMLEKGINRKSVVIALGGGVIGDLAGFVASTIMRGVKFIQMPTTLLSQVDSSVGGKTGINSVHGKNLVGAFYQPQVVVIDTEVLKTLPKREMLAGYAEIVKYGLLGDSKFFEWLEVNGEGLLAGNVENLTHAIEKSCSMKAEIVRQDEFEETGLRALLNLGHTFAHALEAAYGYDGRLLHGEAVGVGLVLAGRLSQLKSNGNISNEDVARIKTHLDHVGMMTEISQIKPSIKLSAQEIMALMQKDKKMTAKGINFVLLNKIGRAKLDNDVPDDMVLKAIEGSLA